MPSRDAPGPRPENQRKRTEVRRPRRELIGLLAVVAVAAIASGIDMLARGDGHLRPTSLVVDPPFVSYRATGTILVFAIGGTQLLAMWRTLTRHLHARRLAWLAALLPLAWGAIQVMVLDVVTWFQLAVLAVGALEVLLIAASTPRTAGKPSRR